MEISHIMEVLNKIESRSGKIRFLEKCLFEEKSDAKRSKIMVMLRGMQKKREPFEARIKQVEKEKIESVVEDVYIPIKESKPKKESQKAQKKIKLESAVEEPMPRTAPVETGETLSGTSIKDYTAEMPEPGKALTETLQEYKPKSVESGYRPRQQDETRTEAYVPRTDMPKSQLEQGNIPEEEYKKRELLRVGEEAKKKQDEYKRKQLLGMI